MGVAGDVLGGWDAAAQAYRKKQEVSAFDAFNRQYLLELLGRVQGLAVLDAGCGDGRYTEMLRQKGARATGCDGSGEMLRLAREAFGHIPFVQCDLTGPLPFDDAEFDLVVCNQVLMDLPVVDIFAREAARVLRPGGRLVFGIVHPAFYTGSWVADEAGRWGKLTYDYLDDTRILENSFWGGTAHFHRPASWYVNLFCGAGLRLYRMEEPAIPGNERAGKIPLFLFACFDRGQA